jgi:hypothetical protein
MPGKRSRQDTHAYSAWGTLSTATPRQTRYRAKEPGAEALAEGLIDEARLRKRWKLTHELVPVPTSAPTSASEPTQVREPTPDREPTPAVEPELEPETELEGDSTPVTRLPEWEEHISLSVEHEPEPAPIPAPKDTLTAEPEVVKPLSPIANAASEFPFPLDWPFRVYPSDNLPRTEEHLVLDIPRGTIKELQHCNGDIKFPYRAGLCSFCAPWSEETSPADVDDDYLSLIEEKWNADFPDQRRRVDETPVLPNAGKDLGIFAIPGLGMLPSINAMELVAKPSESVDCSTVPTATRSPNRQEEDPLVSGEPPAKRSHFQETVSSPTEDEGLWGANNSAKLASPTAPEKRYSVILELAGPVSIFPGFGRSRSLLSPGSLDCATLLSEPEGSSSQEPADFIFHQPQRPSSPFVFRGDRSEGTSAEASPEFAFHQLDAPSLGYEYGMTDSDTQSLSQSPEHTTWMDDSETEVSEEYEFEQHGRPTPPNHFQGGDALRWAGYSASGHEAEDPSREGASNSGAPLYTPRSDAKQDYLGYSIWPFANDLPGDVRTALGRELEEREIDIEELRISAFKKTELYRKMGW